MSYQVWQDFKIFLISCLLRPETTTTTTPIPLKMENECKQKEENARF
jgi:hypothetical protein